MIAVFSRRSEQRGSLENLMLDLIWSARLDRHIFNESEMALFFECMLSCARKVLDIAEIVRDA
jgi:hypothetical protein